LGKYKQEDARHVARVVLVPIYEDERTS
jgi:hypothetical protein